jgi:hypothetical protein
MQLFFNHVSDEGLTILSAKNQMDQSTKGIEA